MARDLGTTNTAQVQSETVRPILFAYLDFVGGAIRAHTGIGNITWGGNTWSGVGSFADISDIEEGVDVAARGLTLSLCGIPSSLLPEALAANCRGRTVQLFLGFTDEAGTLAADPFQVFGGRMDLLSMDDGGDTCSISVQCENRLVDFRRSRVSRYTHEEQIAIHPGDLGLEFIARIADKTINWGPTNSNTAAQSASSIASQRAAIMVRWHL